MARRRYISTTMSIDKRLNQLAMAHGDFAALLYTWMIPHAADDTTLNGDIDEFMATVIPMRRDKTVEEVTAALQGMADLGLIIIDEAREIIRFPPEAFYTHQSFIKASARVYDWPEPENATERHHSLPIDEERRKTPEITEERRESAEIASSVPSPVPVSLPDPAPAASPARARKASPADADAVVADDWGYETQPGDDLEPSKRDWFRAVQQKLGRQHGYDPPTVEELVDIARRHDVPALEAARLECLRAIPRELPYPGNLRKRLDAGKEPSHGGRRHGNHATAADIAEVEAIIARSG